MSVYIFYAGQLIAEVPKNVTVRRFIMENYPPYTEIYNGGFIFTRARLIGANSNFDPTWLKMDSTPVLDEDVPPELKMLVLLLD
jgi:hypothetical protein